MIQPTLTSYTFDNPSFSTVSSQRTMLFLLDPYLYSMASLPSGGRRARENFKELLELPVADAQYLLVRPHSMPRYIVCDEGGSQARFLLSKLNPSTTHMSATMYGSTAGTALAGQAISTDKVASVYEAVGRAVATC